MTVIRVGTNPNSSNWLHRCRIIQFQCGYCKLGTLNQTEDFLQLLHYVVDPTCSSSSLGRALRKFTGKFTQLKRNKNFIMLVWVQGLPFHIAAGSHPVQEAWGYKIICTRSNSKVGSMLSRTIPTDSSCFNDSEKV